MKVPILINLLLLILNALLIIVGIAVAIVLLLFYSNSLEALIVCKAFY